MILVVDDDHAMVQTLSNVLTKEGYEVRSAHNGEEAYRHLLDQKYKGMILDMMMPDINGKETFIRLKDIKPNVRAIMSSGYLPEQNISDLLDLGILGMLHKPFRKSELAKRIKEVLQTNTGA